MIATIEDLTALIAVATGVYLQFGLGYALIAAGLLMLAYNWIYQTRD